MEKKEERKQGEAIRKKSYEKPCIVHQQSLEVVAGVCDPFTQKNGPDDCGGMIYES